MWKNKNVWILLTGEFIAGLGLWLGIIGNLEFMQEKVPSDFLKSLILASGLLAGIAVGPLAGRITDQLNKKTVMLGSGFVRAISVIFMLIAIQTGSVWWMVLFLVIIQLSAPLYFPALQAPIPLFVAEKDLPQPEWSTHECVHPFEDIGHSPGWGSASHSAIIHALYRVAGRLSGSIRNNLVYGF